MRDNEARGARHKVRSDDAIQGLAISNIAQTFEKHTGKA